MAAGSPAGGRGAQRWGRRPRGSDGSVLPQADTSASSVPELERQIEKLAKVSGAVGWDPRIVGLWGPSPPCVSPQRQLFFRKKLLHSSQTLRAAVLGQDRYRRRYWVLPHLGGIFVEGAEGECDEAPMERGDVPGGAPASHLLLLPSQRLSRSPQGPPRRRRPPSCAR